MTDPVQIGPYRVLRAIASGGMARVYEVQDPASEERYALKLLSASEALQRFQYLRPGVGSLPGAEASLLELKGTVQMQFNGNGYLLAHKSNVQRDDIS